MIHVIERRNPELEIILADEDGGFVRTCSDLGFLDFFVEGDDGAGGGEGAAPPGIVAFFHGDFVRVDFALALQ